MSKRPLTGADLWLMARIDEAFADGSASVSAREVFAALRKRIDAKRAAAKLSKKPKASRKREPKPS
jgi:hypothetical protein